MSAVFLPYEYGFVTASLGRRGETGTSSAAQIGAALTRFSAALPGALATMDGGGWEALSHQLVQQDAELIVPVMIRRVQRPGAVS